MAGWHTLLFGVVQILDTCMGKEYAARGAEEDEDCTIFEGYDKRVKDFGLVSLHKTCDEQKAHIAWSSVKEHDGTLV